MVPIFLFGKFHQGGGWSESKQKIPLFFLFFPNLNTRKKILSYSFFLHYEKNPNKCWHLTKNSEGMGKPVVFALCLSSDDQ